MAVRRRPAEARAVRACCTSVVDDGVHDAVMIVTMVGVLR